MKAKLKFTASQYEGFYTCIDNCIKLLVIDVLESYTYFHTLVNLKAKMGVKLPYLKQKNAITLSDLETLAVYKIFSEACEIGRAHV